MSSKLRLTFRSTDVIDMARARFHEENEEFYRKLSEEEMDLHMMFFYNTMNKFISFRDSVTIELDIGAMSARVIPQDELNV